MKLKLDLHPIFSDSGKIEAALNDIIDQACEKRASEVEIIPGKGSGALKKSVLRFLDRPEIKSRYHRIDKDSDNFGRLFVYFKWDRSLSQSKTEATPGLSVSTACFCCSASIRVKYEADEFVDTNLKTVLIDCPGCGSPNTVTIRKSRSEILAKSESGYQQD